MTDAQLRKLCATRVMRVIGAPKGGSLFDARAALPIAGPGNHSKKTLSLLAA